ncbi:MAG: TetR/AcrR family transcriptional regulator [Acidobacteriota bacterium]|nr:TetR/AcrR family transcriptional regulator [Acidobacteriota bacterium]
MPLEGRTKQDVLSEFRCAEILTAARGVFARKGFQAATMDDIAGAAGVGKGTLYLYYRSKRDIYLASLEHGLRALSALTAAEVAAAARIEDKIRAFVLTKVRYFDEQRDFYRIYHAEFGNVVAHPSCLPDELMALYLQQVQQLEQAIQQAVDRGEIRPVQAGTVAFAIFEITRGIITQRLLDRTGSRAEDDGAFIVDLIWKGIGNR